MNFSLALLTALCLLLPGAAFALGLPQFFEREREPTGLDRYYPLGLVVALFTAILFNAAGFVLATVLARLFGLPAPSVDRVLALLSPQTDPRLAAAAMHSVASHPVLIAVYFLGMSSLAWFAGAWAGNRYFPQSEDAKWIPLLEPEGPDFIWFTTEVHMDGLCYLFAGVLDQYLVGPRGNLERVVLKYARRKRLNPPLPGAPPSASTALGAPYGWGRIPGEFLVLKMQDSHTINVDYFYVEDGAPESAS